MDKAVTDELSLLRIVIEESPIPTALYVGREMRIKMANKAFLELSGNYDAVGKICYEALSFHDQASFERLLTKTYETGVIHKTQNRVEVKKEGKAQVLYFDFILKPLQDADGRAWGVLHTATDVTRHIIASPNTDKLLSLVENSVDFMGISDLNLRMVYLNKNGRKLIGVEPDADISRLSAKDFYSPNYFPLIKEKIDPGLKKYGKWSGTIYLRNLKTGEDIPFHADFIQLKDPHTGEPVGRGASLRDLRAEIAANEALVLSEKRFRNLVQQAPVAIGILRGKSLTVEVANREILRLLGKTKSVIGLPLLDAIPELHDQPFPKLLLQVLKTGDPAYGHEETAYFVKNGKRERGYFNFVFAPITEADGSVSGVIVVGNEVTAQVEYKKRLEESEKRFRSIVLEAPVAKALYVGRDLVIDLANESMIKIWGKDQSVIGKKLRDAVPELEGQPFFDILDEVYTTGVPYHTEQQSADFKVDGRLQTFWFNFSYKPLRDSRGEVYAILNTAVDISSQVQLQKQKDDFLGMASHELKTPVTSIKAYAQVLESLLHDSGDREKADMVKKLDHQVSRLTNLINDLLDVTKIKSGRIKFHRSYFDFNELVNEMVEEVQRTTRKHTIVTTLEEVGEIYGDRERLGQVIVNLVTNAIKYSPDSDQVLVTSYIKEGSVELCVEDFGIGISKEKQSRIFEQFYRVSGKKQHTYPGLGLGLYISSEIIKREGGTIWVDSIEGKGSRFYFSLPLNKQKPA